MNQQCKVCGEPAAGFHFGAFTCEGCKSFFGRSYNNLSSISECKNGGECVINKKNRTACKACRLRKCLLVGMSKSGSRYGRRSNWFKIHCLLQEQQQQRHHQRHQLQYQRTKPSTGPSIAGLTGQRRSKEDGPVLGLDDYKNSTSPSISSPESHNSDSSVEVSERRSAYGLHPGFGALNPAHHHGEISALSKEIMSLPLGFHLGALVPPAFLPPPSLFSPYLYGGGGPTGHTVFMTDGSSSSPIGSSNSTTIGFSSMKNDTNDVCNNNNNNRYTENHNVGATERSNVSPMMGACNKRFYLDAILKSQRAPSTRSPASSKPRSGDYSPRSSPDGVRAQENPIDLSIRAQFNSGEESEEDMHGDCDGSSLKRRPMDLTTRS